MDGSSEMMRPTNAAMRAMNSRRPAHMSRMPTSVRSIGEVDDSIPAVRPVFETSEAAS